MFNSFNTYTYEIYATGYKKYLDEFISILADTASTIVFDKKPYRYDSEQNLQYKTVVKSKQVVLSVNYDEISLSEILRKFNTIKQTMELSQLPSYKITLKTLLPIRDDRVLQAKGIVDSTRFWFTKNKLALPPMNQLDRNYTFYCSNLIRGIYHEYYTFPLRPDYTLKDCFFTEEIYSKHRDYFDISSSVFIHNIDLKLELLNKQTGVDFIKKIHIVDETSTDIILDITDMLFETLDYADTLYYLQLNPDNPLQVSLQPNDPNKPDLFTPSSVFNEFVRLIFTSHLRPESPNTYHTITVNQDLDLNIRKPQNENLCSVVTDGPHIKSYPRIRINKKLVKSRINSIFYMYIYYVNIRKYAVKYFVSSTLI